MKYIRIKNDGCIEPQALHLVGASSKRNDNTKIGMFGSGNKYALAYFLRNGYELKIFSGKKEIKVETKSEKFRDMDFNVIYIDGVKTSITTEMGKDWEYWQSLRELISNSIDEGGFSMDFVQNIQPEDDQTHFYIDTKKDVVEFVTNFDNYFSMNKKVLFECKDGKILEKSGNTANVYRKGIKCFNTSKTSLYDYSLENISIDENRLVKYSWEVEEHIWNLIYQCDKEEVIMQVLTNCCEAENIESAISDYSSINASKMSQAYKNVIKKLRVAPKGYAGLLSQDEIHNHVIVPTKVFQAMRGQLKDENVGDSFKLTNSGAFYRIIEPNKLQAETIKQAMYFFKEVGFEMPYEVVVAIFDEKKVLGYAEKNNNTKDGRILLSDVGLERGVNEVVNIMIEEFIHLKYDVRDKTRDFQDRIIAEMVSYMKKVNSFVI